MSSPIHTWTDAYAAIRDAIEARRGFIELAPDTPQATRWPRATGAQVIAIAAVLDPALRQSPPAFGRAALMRQWRDVLVDAEATALLEPSRTYPMARAFWAAARAVCVHLDHVGVRVPDCALWDALLGALDQDDEDHARRNAGGLPTALLTVERRALLAKRGADGLPSEPPAHYHRVALGDLFYPRVTVGDVVTLAIAWNDRLAAAMRAHPSTLVVAATAWHRIIDDVTATTRGVAAEEPYAHGRAFWDGLAVLAMAMDQAIAPATHAALAIVGRAADAVSDVPGALQHGAEAVGDGVLSIIEGAAHGAGALASGAASGFFAPFLVPLALGGGALGLYFLTRNRGEKGAA